MEILPIWFVCNTLHYVNKYRNSRDQVLVLIFDRYRNNPMKGNIGKMANIEYYFYIFLGFIFNLSGGIRF